MEHPITTGTIGADGVEARPVTVRGRTREEQALAELGHTSFSRGVAATLTAAFVVTILIVPVVQAWSALNLRALHPVVGSAPGANAMTLAGLGPGPGIADSVRHLIDRVPAEPEIRAFETRMEQRSVVGSSVRSWAQDVLSNRFGIGNDNVYIGRDGWLFYRAGVEYATGPGFLSPNFLARRRLVVDVQEPDPRPSIVRFRDQLAARGIALVLMPTPDKIMLYPDRFYGGAARLASMPQNPSFDRFRYELERKGVSVFDPAPMLYAKRAEQALFQRTDTHWTPATAELVAHELAQHVRVLTRLPAAPSKYEARPAEAFWGMGDLSIMLQVPAGGLLGATDTLHFRQVVGPSGALWTPSPSAPVLMLGDSFCMSFETDRGGRPLAAGLPQQLSFELQQPVDRICAAGGGSYLARFLLAYELANRTRTLEHVKVIVWQFTIRDLVAGDWRVIDLPGS